MIVLEILWLIIQILSWWFSCGAVGFIIGTVLDYLYYEKQPDNFIHDMLIGFLLGFLTLIVAVKTMAYIVIDMIQKGISNAKGK